MRRAVLLEVHVSVMIRYIHYLEVKNMFRGKGASSQNQKSVCSIILHSNSCQRPRLNVISNAFFVQTLIIVRFEVGVYISAGTGMTRRGSPTHTRTSFSASPCWTEIRPVLEERQPCAWHFTTNTAVADPFLRVFRRSSDTVTKYCSSRHFKLTWPKPRTLYPAGQQLWFERYFFLQPRVVRPWVHARLYWVVHHTFACAPVGAKCAACATCVPL